MKITFLGTGDSFGSGGRHSISILARDQGFGILLDCGPGSLPMMKRVPCDPGSVDVVLISHHHGDHFAGVPFLLLEYQYQSPRRHRLAIAGPPGTADKIERLTRLLFPGLASEPRSYELDFPELRAEETMAFGAAEVTPFPARHLPRGIAFGFRLSMGGKTIVYSGDTEWTDDLALQSEGADLLICECSTFSDPVEFHMSHRELVARRDRIKAKRVLLIHAGEDVLARSRDLMFELAEDGQEVRL